ncbi:MAG: AAA family ATPase, partial [Acidimicrobiia bacterium]
MFLRSLSLVGFKSFADRTRLEFGPGINVVVGPNGSGKSNLVDAVAWVMGTQATSALRLQKMDELIFNGTAVRNPHGRAEVTLTFDNTSGDLPLDLPEVTLTRRLHRDGTSEYEINAISCRLQDISDLLSDSGVGRHQHVVIGQGRIAEILNARPEDQRMVIEEAAGVTKYRNRRDRALRRLEATAGDVQRLTDILTEQQRRMRPLRRQAKAAERYEALNAEARSLRLWIGGEELRSVASRQAEVAASLATTGGRIAEIVAETERLESDLARLDGDAERAATELDDDTAAAARLETTVQRLERIAAVARERRRSDERARFGEEERKAAAASEMEEITAEMVVAESEAVTVHSAAERLSQQVVVLETEERALTDQMQMPAEGLEASLRGDLVALEATAVRDQAEREDVEARRRVVGEMIRSHDGEARRINDEVRDVDAAASSLTAAYADAEAACRTAEAKRAEAARRLEESRSSLAAARARAEALVAHAAIGDGTGAFGDDPEVGGPILDHLGVPAHLNAAVTAALGTWSSARVTSGPGGTASAAGRLKRAGHGGVALVGSTADAPVPAREAALWGGSALCDLLEGDAALAASLLGDVAVFEGWSSAWRFVELHPQLRAVTPDGDMIT